MQLNFEGIAGVDYRNKEHLSRQFLRRNQGKQFPHGLDAHIFIPMNASGHHKSFSGTVSYCTHPLDGISSLYRDGKGIKPRDCYYGKSRDVPCNHFRETNLPPHRSRRLRSSSFSRSTSKRLVGLSITIISGFSIITRSISLR